MTKSRKADESRTDWARVLADEAANKSVVLDDDDTELTASELAGAVVRRRGQRGKQRTPPKVPVSIRIEPEVILYFKSINAHWQTAMHDVLKAHAKLSSPAETMKRASRGLADSSRKVFASAKRPPAKRSTRGAKG